MNAAEKVLREAGLRVTKQRIAVYETVQNHPHVLTDTVIHEVRGKLGRVSIQAVYDALASLTEAGLVRKIEPAGSPTRYETRTGDNHHHVVCRLCGAIADVDCAIGAAPCLTPVESHGFTIDVAEVTYWGVCPLCRAPKEDRDQRNSASLAPTTSS